MRHSPAANRAPAGAHPPTRPAAADDTTAMRPWAQPVPRPKMVAPIVGAWWYARSRRRGRHGTAHPDAPCWERGRGGEDGLSVMLLGRPRTPPDELGAQTAASRRPGTNNDGTPKGRGVVGRTQPREAPTQRKTTAKRMPIQALRTNNKHNKSKKQK